MIESDPIVLEDFNLELIIVIIVAVFVPYVFGAIQDFVLVRLVGRGQTVQDYDQIYAEFGPIDNKRS